MAPFMYWWRQYQKVKAKVLKRTVSFYFQVFLPAETVKRGVIIPVDGKEDCS